MDLMSMLFVYQGVVGILGLLAIGILFILTTSRQTPHAGLPLITLSKTKKPRWKSWLEGPGDKMDYIFHGPAVLDKGKSLTDGAFQVRGGSCYNIILPNRFASELHNHPDLSFVDPARQDLMAKYHGFDGMKEAFREDGLMIDIVRVNLTRSLGMVTGDVVDEGLYSLKLRLGDCGEWKTHQFKDVMLDVVARTSTRVFAGRELARNQEWLGIAKEYTVKVYLAAQALQRRTAFLRPLLQWFIPECAEVRRQASLAREFITPIFSNRLQQWHAADDSKRKSIDSFIWMLEAAKGRKYDPVGGQLMLNAVAIHTTTETIGRCFVRLCEHPELVQPLREEMIAVLTEFGWEKTTLYKLKLLDSFLKEVSRTYAIGLIGMGRCARKRIVCSDGTIIPKGGTVFIMNDKTKDEAFYPNADKFDAWRYVKLRERPGEESKYQFVATSPINLYFGHGNHACPGRFFASNEIKILFCVLLLRYDIRFEPNASPPSDFSFECITTLDPNLRLQVRRRREEIYLADPKAV